MAGAGRGYPAEIRGSRIDSSPARAFSHTIRMGSKIIIHTDRWDSVYRQDVGTPYCRGAPRGAATERLGERVLRQPKLSRSRSTMARARRGCRPSLEFVGYLALISSP